MSILFYAIYILNYLNTWIKTLIISAEYFYFSFRGTTISGTPSKYHFAAHFGQLIRGIETQSCMNFYPQCPFSEHDVRTIARKIAKIR